MTEIEIETYSSENYSDDDENYEYSLVLITPDENIDKESNEKSKQESISKRWKDHSNNSSRHHTHNNSLKKDSPFNENSKFSKFIDRQNAANKRQIKNRDNPPSERQFNPPPFHFILQSAIPPPKIESPSQKQTSVQCTSLFQRSIHQTSPQTSPSKSYYSNTNSFMGRNNESSFNYANEDINEDVNLLSKNSESIVDEKNLIIVNNTCGNQRMLNIFKLEQILRRFHIKEKLLISEICTRTKINAPSEVDNPMNEVQHSIYGDRLTQSNDSTLYDNRILKKILIRAIFEDINNLSDFEIKLRNCISYSFRNGKYLSKKKKL